MWLGLHKRQQAFNPKKVAAPRRDRERAHTQDLVGLVRDDWLGVEGAEKERFLWQWLMRQPADRRYGKSVQCRHGKAFWERQERMYILTLSTCPFLAHITLI